MIQHHKKAAMTQEYHGTRIYISSINCITYSLTTFDVRDVLSLGFTGCHQPHRSTSY